MTKIIGLTGGIGSGKTTIANYMKSLGIPVFIADEESKKLLMTPEILFEIKKEFGETIFQNGLLNKAKLASIVFQDPKMLKKLNSILHPAVQRNFRLWLVSHSNAPIVVKEAAILFESGSAKDCHAVITVEAPLEERIRRVVERDNVVKEEVMNRINNQWTSAMRRSKSDYVIENTDYNMAIQQTREILKKIEIQ